MRVCKRYINLPLFKKGYIFGTIDSTMPKNLTLAKKQGKMACNINEFLKTSQYIVTNFKAPMSHTLPYAVCLAYANALWPREQYKTLNKRPVAQKKLVDKLTTAFDEIKHRFVVNFNTLKERLCEQTRTITGKPYIKPDLTGPEYSHVYNCLDIYPAMLDCNIHVMDNTLVQNKYVQQWVENQNSLVSVFDSYGRDNVPHIYLWRQKIFGENCFHVISDIDNIMDNVFGYLNFCEGCYQTTYATSDMHKQYYCKRVEAHDQFMKNRSWSIHPDNIRGAVIASGYGKPVSEQVRAERSQGYRLCCWYQTISCRG